MVCKVDGVRTALSTAAAGNTQDFTVLASVVGAYAPRAAFFFVTKASADNTATNEGVMSIGWTDGTNHRCWASDQQNVGVGNTNNKCRGETAEVIYVHNVAGTGTQGRASFATWINDGTNVGVRITIDTQFAAAYKIGVMLVCGADPMGAAGDFAAPSASGTTTVTGLPFRPDLVFHMGCKTWNSVNVDDGHVVLGISIRTPAIANKGYNWGCADNLGTSAMFVAIDDFTGYVGGTADARNPRQAVTSFTSDGFVVTESGGSTGAPQAYLALELPNVPLWLDFITTPTSTGNASFTGPGFQPQAYVLLTTMADATAATQVDTRASACGIGFVAGSAPTAHGQSISLKDNVSVQVAKCASDAAAASQLGDAGTILIKAAHNAMLSNGVQLNFNPTDSTARKWAMLAIGSNIVSDPLPRRRAIRHFLGR